MPAEPHLQMIQTVIARLATQSTSVKGWCVTVTAALLGFGTTTTRPAVATIAVYVIVAFAILDGYYLALERSYRRLYRAVVDGQAADWTLTVGRPSLGQVTRALGSPAIALLYGASLATAVAVASYLFVS